MLSLSEFKSYLQISDSTYDTLFAIYEPIIQELIEKITGKRFGVSYTVSTSENSNILTTTEEVYDDDVYAGASLSCDNLPDDTLLYDWNAHSITVDKKATTTGSATLTVSIVPEALKLIASKMILFDIKGSTVTQANKGGIASKSMGLVSVSYDKNNSIDPKYGYPRSLIGAVKRFKRSSIDIGRKRYPYMDTTNRRIM